MSILTRLFFVLLADERIELFELFDFIFGADEGGVWGVDDDDVLAAEKGDEVRGVGGDGEVAGTFDEEGFGSVLGGWCALGVPGAARRGEHGAVALRIWVREGSVRGPGAYVLPLEVEGDASDGDVGVLGCGFHDAVVDGFFGDGRVDIAHEGGLLLGAFRAGNALDGFGDCGLVLSEELKEARGLEDEHAGVPEVARGAFGDEALSGRQVGFFAKAAYAADGCIRARFFGGHLQKGVRPQLEIAVGGRRKSGLYAEGDEDIGLRLDCCERGAQGFAEARDRLDDMVGGEEGDGCVGGFLAHEGAGKADRHKRIAAFGFADVAAKGGDFCPYHCLVARAATDPATLRGDYTFETLEGGLKEALAFEHRNELFRHGFARKRPEADAGAAGKDDSVAGHGCS